MESVKVFNAELSGLYETKPPISKAKMASITRSAMKAIKFYKHVVQSVEKFILKCKPEYKIPGLYVIDSIVRQSRHQFGADKDVFAPRFARNMESTFANLFRCAPEDKSKIIRVLNLWQKNSVFVPEVIQPLFDLANPDHPMHQQIANQAMQDTSATSNGLNTSGMSQESPPQMTDDHNSSSGIHTHQEQQMTPSKPFDQNTIRQLQQFQQILMRQTSGGGDVGNSGNPSNKDSVKFNKKLLDFDYGSEEEEEKHSSPHLPNLLPDTNIAQILSDPNVLKQLQNLQKLKQEEKQTKMNEMRLQEEKFEKHLANVLKKLPFANECDLSRQPPNEMPPGMSGPKGEGNEQEVEYVSSDVQVINLDGNDSRSSSPSRDRYKRRKSRSRSRDRRDRRRRSRSRSRERRRRSRSTSRDYKDKDREREKERKRKGLPDIKKEHLSVCSTTLWVGHISKLVQQEELSDTFGKFGDIVSIDMIPPRGCAYIVMNRRQDAHKSMQNLKNHKMQGRPITISWAAGKGVKSKEWKDYWDMELGVCYIPWNKLSSATDLQALEEGGMFDEDTMPSWMKDKSGQSTSSGSAKKTETKDPTPAIPPLFDMARVDTSQPPPAAPMMPMVAPFQMSGVPQFLPIPPNMVPGLQMNVPPPQMMMPGAAHMAPLPGFGVALPPPPPTIPQTSNSSNTNDDHMDIEMEEETTAPPKHDKPAAPQPLLAGPFYNHPPPSLGGIANLTSLLGGHDNNNMQRGDDYDRRNDKDNRPRRDDHGGRDRERDDRRGRDRDRGNDRESRGDNRRDNYRNNDRNNRWGNRGNSRDRERDINSRDREKPGSDYNNRRDRNSFDSESNNSFRGGAAFGQGQGFRDQQGGPRMSGRGDFNRGEDFDRRGGFNQNNRFAGPGARGGMGMGRNGPGFGQQRGGFHFNNDRGGPMNQGMQERGMRNTPNAKFNNSNDRRGGRQNWRDEEERGGFNRFDRNNRRGGSRWEENEDRNRNRSRSPQRPGSDLSNSLPDEDWENLPESNGGFEPSSSNESKKHEYEDNGPPGFENESQDQDNNQGNGAGTPLYDEPQEPVKQTPQMSCNDDMDDRARSPMPSSQQTSNFEQEPQEHHHQQQQQRDERLEQQPPSPPLHSSSTAQSVEYRSESPEFHSQQQQYQEQEEQQQKQYQEQEEQQQKQYQELEQQQHQQPDPEPQPMPENNEPAESAEGDEA